MAPRRSHAKSRRGCDTCRDRRVKCDETGPPCSNCTARQIECTYHKARQFTDRDQHTATLPTVGRGTRDIIQKRELELLHRYSTSTHESLTHIFEVPDEVWRLFVVQQAFKHDFLLNGILSLAASHAASEGNATRHDYLVIAAEYLELALPEFRPSLNAISDDNAHAVYVFGMVLCTALFSQLESSVAHLTWVDLLDKLNSIYECLSGVGRVIATNLEQLCASPLGSILARLEAKHTACMDENVLDGLSLLKRLADEHGATLQPLNQQSCRYDKMIDDLKACWVHQIFVIDWLTNTGREFQTNLRRGGMMETLLLAHWGIAVCTLHKYWFIKDLGRAIAQMALEQIGTVDGQTQHSISWVQEQISLDRQ